MLDELKAPAAVRCSVWLGGKDFFGIAPAPNKIATINAPTLNIVKMENISQ